MTTTPASRYGKAGQRVTLRVAGDELDAIEALAAAMDLTTSQVLRAGIARLHADVIESRNTA